MEWSYQDYRLTDERARVDVRAVHALLRGTYWAAERPPERIRLSIENSLCFSLFAQARQVGLARVISDYATTSYLCDVVLDPAHRSQGLGSWLMQRVLEHPAVQGTRLLLITRDAQIFYRRLGFATHPYECMIRRHPGG